MRIGLRLFMCNVKCRDVARLANFVRQYLSIGCLSPCTKTARLLIRRSLGTFEAYARPYCCPAGESWRGISFSGFPRGLSIQSDCLVQDFGLTAAL